MVCSNNLLMPSESLLLSSTRKNAVAFLSPSLFLSLSSPVAYHSANAQWQAVGGALN
jgi:hypothetical protein